MPYDSDKPAANDYLSISDDTIRANFLQIVANWTNQHDHSDDTAADAVHHRACGLIELDMTFGSHGSWTGVDENLSFTPNLVEFKWMISNGSATDIQEGTGYYDGTTNTCFHSSSENSVNWTIVTRSGWCMEIYSSKTVTQVATCEFGTNKFTLNWRRTLILPSGTAYIRYVAFG